MNTIENSSTEMMCIISVLDMFNSEIHHNVSNKKQPKLSGLEIITMNSHVKTNENMKRQQKLKKKKNTHSKPKNKIISIQI